ncbi:putative von willebrand factor protein, partial [Triangularia verruculosa]
KSDDPHAFLAIFDVVFLIDDSGSMGWAGRWAEAGKALETIAPICTKYDADGIDIHFLNKRDEDRFKNVESAQTVHEILTTVRPEGLTPTASRINDILKPYVRKFEEAVKKSRVKVDDTGIKPLILIVLTDGQPAERPDLGKTIKNLAGRLDEADAPSHQVGITFFQVGDDIDATAALKKLDDEIEGVRDMVDTATFDTYAEKAGEKGVKTLALSADGILKVFLSSYLIVVEALILSW